MEKKPFDVMKAVFGKAEPKLDAPVTAPPIPSDPIFLLLGEEILATLNRFERKFGYVVPFAFLAASPVRDENGVRDITALCECEFADWRNFTDAFVTLKDTHIQNLLRANGMPK